MVTNIATFPGAVHEGAQSFWYPHTLLDWFAQTQTRPIDRALIEVPEVTMKVNIASDAHRTSGIEKNIEVLVA